MPISRPTAWYTDKDITKQLPLLLRFWALYARLMQNAETGRIPGGSFLLRKISRLRRLSEKYRDCPITIGHRTAFFNLSDPDSLRALATIYSPPAECKSLLEQLSEGSTFIDVGANYGAYSYLAAEIVGRSGNIEAIEPQPELAKLLAEMLSHASGTRFNVHQIACGNISGQASLFVPRWSSGRASLCSENRVVSDEQSKILVRTSPLDDVLDWQQWTGKVVMKLDVEGHEIKALHGSRRLIEHHRPAILCEINHRALAESGSSAMELVDTLVALGYSVFAWPELYPQSCAANDLGNRLETDGDLLALE